MNKKYIKNESMPHAIILFIPERKKITTFYYSMLWEVLWMAWDIAILYNAIYAVTRLDWKWIFNKLKYDKNI